MTNENTIRVVMAEAERQTKRAANQVSDWLAGNCAGEVPRIQLALLVEVSRAAAGHLESTPAATSAARARTCYSCKHHDAPGSSSGDSPCWDCTAPGHPGVMPRWEAAATAAQPAQQPLDEERREAEFMRWNLSPGAHGHRALPESRREAAAFYAGIAAAERAHNIGPAAGATWTQPVRWSASRIDPDTIRLTSSEGETQAFKRPTGDSAPESEHLVWRMACKLADGPATGATGGGA